jgi:hypothetical protein
MGRLWLGAVLFALLLGGLQEAAFRHGGHKPAVADNATTWAMQRRKLEQSDTTKQIAIVGASRAQMGLNPQVMEQQLPGYCAVMLAVDGSNCLSTLDDLANNSTFKGTILCSFNANLCVTGGDTQDKWIEQYHRMMASGAWINTMFDQALRTWLQNNFVLCSYSPYELIHAMLVDRHLPSVRFERMEASRFREADFAARSESWMREHRQHRVERLKEELPDLPQAEKDTYWQAMLVRLHADVSAIQARGGKVILIRMPTTGAHYDYVTRIFPRQQYWDKLASAVGAQTLFFEDYPELTGYDCPDLSHLNVEDAKSFTAALMQVLKKQGVFAGLNDTSAASARLQ